MRRFVPLVVLLMAAGPAAAQTRPLDQLRLDSLRQQNMRAQEQQNLLRRDKADADRATAERHRRDTRANLRGVAPTNRPSADPAAAAAIAAIPAADAQLRRIEDKELADSNARLRAITPAQ